MNQSPVTLSPVCVTGAAGFIASRIVEQLLARGYRVRGTVRSLRKEKDLAHLRALPGASTHLELVEADLRDASTFDAAVAGCTHVLHTASPYTLEAKDPQKDLVDPAVEGTRNVLLACQRAATVRRVVVTSSMAAITDEPESDHVLTEADWNDKSTLERNPYYLSKTLAEREAWRFLKEGAPDFELVTINPFLVIGPSLTAGINPSNQLFVDLFAGKYPGIMNLTWGFVDVRDVADAHVRAMEAGCAMGRYICAGETIAMRDMVAFLRDLDADAATSLPKIGLDCGIGDFTVRLSSYLQPKGVGSYLRTHVGRVPRYDTSKIQKELGVSFRPVRESIRDTVADLQRWKHLAAASA